MALDVTVLVVGAGPTGLLLAAELLRRGVGCRLIDAHPAPLHWDRATVVHPRSLEVFDSLGLLESFLAAGVKQKVARLHSDGEVLGEIDLALCGSRYGFNLGLSEEVTESILAGYLQRQGGEVVRAARLVDLEESGARLVARIERSDSAEEVRADWVVGCDGLHSTARERSGIELVGHDIPEPWAVFDATLTGWPESYEANYAYLDAVPVILTALPGRRWRVYLRPTSPGSDLVADAIATIGRYLPRVRFADVENPVRFHCHTKVAARFRSGRVLLAGDAAHVCSPAKGHGMNGGLQDAFNLAWKLALVCQGRSGPDLLDSYEAERRPVAAAATASSDAADLAQTVTDPVGRRGRDAVLRAAFADPSSRHLEAIAEAELDIDYRSSPVVLGDASDVLGPGARLPDTIEVSLPGGEVAGLHELTHRPGHTALLLGSASAPRDSLAGLERAVAAGRDGSFVEAVFVVTQDVATGRLPWARMEEAAGRALGVVETTLLVVRPDGHVGLRADRDHREALRAYEERLARGG